MVTKDNPTQGIKKREALKEKLEKEYNELPETHPFKATMGEVTKSIQLTVESMRPFREAGRERMESVRSIFSSIDFAGIQRSLEAWRIREAERHEKGEQKITILKEEWGNTFGAKPLDYNQFIQWYDKFVLWNFLAMRELEEIEDLIYHQVVESIINNKDVCVLEHNGTKYKIIGVNSTSFEQYAIYKIKQHKSQANGDVWTDGQEYNRMKDFIIVGNAHPIQVEEPEMTTQEKVIKIFEEKDPKNNSVSDLFFNKTDYIAFIEALILHIEGKRYEKPNTIQIKSGGIKKIAKAIHEATLNPKYAKTLSKDDKLFDLIRVLEPFKENSDKKIAKDLQR